MVNGILVGRNKSTILDHNTLISIAKTKTYVFMVKLIFDESNMQSVSEILNKLNLFKFAPSKL